MTGKEFQSELPENWQDARTERYQGPCRYRFNGDPDLCARYVPTALLILGQLRNQLTLDARPSGKWDRRLSDGAEITVQYDGTINMIAITPPPGGGVLGRTCPFYLESGLVDYVFPGTDFPERSVPGTLHRAVDDKIPFFKAEDQGSMVHATPPKLGVEWLKFLAMPANGAESKAFGVPELHQTYPNDEERDKAVHDGRVRLYSKIFAGSLCASSLYTGKLQAFVQSLYGDNIRNWRATCQLVSHGCPQPPQFPYGFPELVLDGAPLTWCFEDSSGIFTDETHLQYYLIRIMSISVPGNLYTRKYKITVRRIELNNCAKALRGFLQAALRRGTVNTQLDFNRLESYLLNNCGIGQDVWTLTLPDNPPQLTGLPFDQYGWKFNWNGTEAHLIIHELVKVDASHYQRTARHVKLAFALNAGFDPTDPESKPLTYILSTVEEVDYHFRPGQDLIWYYDYCSGVMLTVVTPISATEAFGDAPIYCFHNSADELQIIRYSYEESEIDPPPPGFDRFATLRLCFGDAGWPSENPTQDDEYIWGLTKHCGFYCEALDARITHGEHEFHRHNRLELHSVGPPPEPPVYDGNNYGGSSINPNFPGKCCTAFGGFDIMGPNRTGTWTFPTQECTAYLVQFLDDREVMGQTEFDTMVIIPHSDARAVYMGTYEDTLPHHVTDRIDSTDTGYRQYFYEYVSPHMEIGTVGPCLGGLGFYIDTTANFDEVVDNSGLLPETEKVKVWLVTRDSSAVNHPIKTEDRDSLGPWDAFFNPNMVFDPSAEQVMSVVHSLTNDFSYINHIDEHKMAGDYLYFPLFSFVGWA